MVTLNESGAFLWNELKENGDIDSLVESLTKEYNVSKEEAGKDIQEFIDVLKAHALIEE